MRFVLQLVFLVGGPAGSMEAGRQVKRILSAKNVPHRRRTTADSRYSFLDAARYWRITKRGVVRTTRT